MVSILENGDSGIHFSEDIEEFILDKNMKLKALKLRSGETIDHRELHRHFNPRHPLLKTPRKLKKTLDQFFVLEFSQKRNIPFIG
jgi:hypothetical protein